MVGSFENRPSKRSVFEWIRYSNVRYSSPDCTQDLQFLCTMFLSLKVGIFMAWKGPEVGDGMLDFEEDLS